MKPVASRALSPLMFAALLALHSAPTVVAPARAATTERVSVSSTGQPANSDSMELSISADGRFVAFWSLATNLVAGDTNGVRDVFVRDLQTGVTERVSVAGSGAQANGHSLAPSISADGRFVAFHSGASNLVAGDTNGYGDILVHDRFTGATERASVGSSGEQGNDHSAFPSISADGRFVAFRSTATNLVPGDTNGWQDIFVRDTVTGTTERVSVSSAGAQANGESGHLSISADGRFVAFDSFASNLVPADTNQALDVFVHDRVTGVTERVSVSSGGEQGDSHSVYPAISGDGRFVAFMSGAGNLAPGGYGTEVFLRDRQIGTTVLASVWVEGPPDCGPGYFPSISADGRYVAFETAWLAGEMLLRCQVYVRDMVGGTTELASVSSVGEMGNSGSGQAAISADGRFVAFESSATNLVPGDTNYKLHVFVRELARPSTAQVLINWGAACTSSASVTLNMQFPDACVEMRLRNEPGDWGAWEPCAIGKPWTLPAGDGLKTVCMQCRDGLGNLSGEACDEIVLDTTPPTGLSITIEWGADCTDYPDEAQLHISAADAAFRRFRNDGGDWSSWEQNTELPWYGKYWALSPDSGLKTVFFQCRDSCGNESAVVSDTIWVPIFVDVICADSQRPYIEALVRDGITAGCRTNPPVYCRLSEITREQMAVFLCRAAGKGPLDRATPSFCDVPKTNPYYAWIERLADADSWGGNPPTIGCAWLPCRQYCPSKSVTRDEMAAFLVRATGRQPVASCAGIFADVDRGGWACPFIERIADPASWRGGAAVTNGCAPNPLRYCPKSAITRGQMAVFLVRAFGIPL